MSAAKHFFQIISFSLLMIFVATNGNTQTTGSESWNGIFSTKDQGDVKVNLFFSFKDSSGTFSMPDIIPFALDLYELRQWGDSMSFKVDFRTGTVLINGKYIHPETIKGVSIRQSGFTLPFTLYKSKTSNSIFNLPKPAAIEKFEIKTKHNSDKENASKQRLEKILFTYPIEKYIYTKNVIIQDSMIPHSHPVLTINTEDTTDENLISSFVHEQMHWFILSKNEECKAAVAELKEEFPNAKINFPDGSGDEASTYNHLVVCYFEYQAVKELTGKEKAEKVIDYLKSRIYKWVYLTMLNNEQKIGAILKKHNVVL